MFTNPLRIVPDVPGGNRSMRIVPTQPQPGVVSARLGSWGGGWGWYPFPILYPSYYSYPYYPYYPYWGYYPSAYYPPPRWW